MTKAERAAKIESLLKEVQKKYYHEPDSDYYEYCNGCGCSPYNVPPHKKDCLVPRIAKALEALPKKEHDQHCRCRSCE